MVSHFCFCDLVHCACPCLSVWFCEWRHYPLVSHGPVSAYCDYSSPDFRMRHYRCSVQFVLLFVYPAPWVGTRGMDQFEGSTLLCQWGLSRVHPVRNSLSKGFASPRLIRSRTTQ